MSVTCEARTLMQTHDEPGIDKQPGIGDMVHYVLPDGPSAGEHRPAIVVRVWQNAGCNLQVFTDASNDGFQVQTGTLWATSVPYSAGGEPGTWHWPESK